jgi:hypothetical protein
MWAIDASATATANPGIMPRKILEMRMNIVLSNLNPYANLDQHNASL